MRVIQNNGKRIKTPELQRGQAFRFVDDTTRTLCMCIDVFQKGPGYVELVSGKADFLDPYDEVLLVDAEVVVR